MRYSALACDYDGTLASAGHVNDETLRILNRLRILSYKLILVTGRELPDLLAIFPSVDLFDRIVAENGALLYRPAKREEKRLAPPPPEPFVQALRKRGVTPLAVGQSIVATHQPNEMVVLETIRNLGLELQVIFNKDAVMVLPTGVNKATGLTAALAELGLLPDQAVGIGDAENDHAFLELCGYSVVVANGLPSLKEKADMVTRNDNGKGVIELINRILANAIV